MAERRHSREHHPEYEHEGTFCQKVSFNIVFMSDPRMASKVLSFPETSTFNDMIRCVADSFQVAANVCALVTPDGIDVSGKESAVAIADEYGLELHLIHRTSS